MEAQLRQGRTRQQRDKGQAMESDKASVQEDLLGTCVPQEQWPARAAGTSSTDGKGRT